MLIESFDTLNSIFKNKTSICCDEGYYHFSRFTEAQLEVYGSAPHTKSRSLCTSGICLDFYSDTDYIRFEYKIFERARDWMYFDIYINDVFVKSIGSEPIGSDTGFFDYNKCSDECSIGCSDCDEMKRFTIFLPHLCNVGIRHLEVSDSARLKMAPVPDKGLLCLGDSITQGMEAKRPSSAFAVQLARFFNMNLINQGVGGYTFRKTSLDADFKMSPHIITVAYGTNDWDLCNSINHFESNASDYIELLIKIFPESRILVLSPTWRGDMTESRPAGEFHKIADTLRNICSSYASLEFIDGLSLVPHLPKLFSDGLHPNDEGFMHYSMNLIKAVK
ncbi:MAG: SGNH/GDSL hydrolase family protein [Eubacteriales bacterium]|nr:SGNH/GDSL hydrolase family protein [Eubacteriales bacterium]